MVQDRFYQRSIGTQLFDCFIYIYMQKSQWIISTRQCSNFKGDLTKLLLNVKERMSKYVP